MNPHQSYAVYTAKSWINVAGRGTIAVVNIGQQKMPKIDDTVMIDGSLYLIRGIEITSSKQFSNVGLIVRPVQDRVPQTENTILQ